MLVFFVVLITSLMFLSLFIFGLASLESEFDSMSDNLDELNNIAEEMLESQKRMGKRGAGLV